jgi:hypothetical protein
MTTDSFFPKKESTHLKAENFAERDVELTIAGWETFTFPSSQDPSLILHFAGTDKTLVRA